MLKGKGYLSTHVCFPNLNCFMDAWFDSQMPIHRFHPHLRGFRYIYIYVVYIYINTTCLHVHLSFKPLTWQYGLPKDFPNGCCRYAMSQKNNMSTVDDQSVPILKMCEWVQLATNKHPDLVVLCIKSTSDTSRSSKNRTSQKSENSISIYHPQKQLNRVSAPHVPRSKEISHIRDLCIFFVTYFWLLNDKCACFFVEFGPISLQHVSTVWGRATVMGQQLCLVLWIPSGVMLQPHMAPCLSMWIIYIYDFWVILEGKCWQICYSLIKLAVHWGKSIHWLFRGAPWILSWKSMAFVVSSHPHRCWVNIPI